MNAVKHKHRATLSWMLVSALFLLCGALGILQYRWIGEVSLAARDRLRGSLQGSLARLSADFNTEISGAFRALLPDDMQPDMPSPAEADFTARYLRWKKTARHPRLFKSVAIAMASREGRTTLRALDLERGVFATTPWPAGWRAIRERVEFRFSPEPWMEHGPPRPLFEEDEGTIFVLPLPGWRREGPPQPSFEAEPIRFLIVELSLPYLRDVVLPEKLQHHLGGRGGLDYQVEVVAKTNPSTLIYRSDPGSAKWVSGGADATVSLFDLQYDQLFHFGSPPGGPERERRKGPAPEAGRWQLSVRHRTGSLEIVVERARWRNLAVTAGVLLLMLASVAALIRYTRRAQKLAELQMDFVAGVSHELRTPLTVIHTAAYNLRGRISSNPGQVERYGALIQQESGRLKELVEQVLQFASTKAGRVTQEFEALAMETVIEEALEASRSVLEAARCEVERGIEAGLPLVLGDPRALTQVVQNLLSNAMKYGAGKSRWIGVYARQVLDQERAVVELRVADRGPGIPAAEQKHVFEPFFRGKRALQDQIHGTGLGLSLVKEIVEAHGGSIAVHSEPGKETGFVVRIPAAPQERQDEFAHSLGRG